MSRQDDITAAMTQVPPCSCPQSLALQRDLDAARAERDAALNDFSNAVDVGRRLDVRLSAVIAEVAALRGALADTPENVEALTPGLASAAAYGELRVYDGNRHSIARGILGILRGRLPVTPGGDR